MMIAVEDQYFDSSIELTVLTIPFCSSSGSDSPSWPLWAVVGFRKLTDGRLPSFSVSEKADRSYWWLAWSVRPIAASEVGGRWAGLAVVALNWKGSQCGVYSWSSVPAMFSLSAPQTAPPLLVEVGANPPWN